MSGPMFGWRFGDREQGSHDPWDSLIAGYALHALEPQEEIALEAHLPDCPGCTAAVAAAQQTAAELADAVDPVSPPPAMRAAVLHAFAASTGGVTQLRPRRPVELGHDAPDVVADPRPGGSGLSLATARLRRSPARTPRSLALVAAGLVLLAGTGIGIGAVVRAHNANRQLDRTAAMLACVQEQGCQVVPLTTGPLDHADRGAVLMRGTDVTLVVRDLPANGADDSYVLWQKQRSGEVLPVGAFDVRRSISVSPTMGLHDVADMALLAVTREPGHTPPPAPTSAPVAVATVV